MSLPARPIDRRALVMGLGPALVASHAGAGAMPLLAMLGDSITAGYGLPAAAALPAQLAAALGRLSQPVRMRAAGVSGDTTADGLARVDFSIPADASLCLVALGGNDLLQGVEPRIMARNLDQILARLAARRIRAMLIGIHAPVEIGAAYARDYNAVFTDLAKKHAIPLYADLLSGVSGHPALIQGDGVHPNAEGVKIIAARLAPVVKAALAGRRG